MSDIPSLTADDKTALHTLGAAESAHPKTAFVTFARALGKDIKRDFRGADLRRFDLRGQDLGETDLSDADLLGADVRGANLSQVRGLTSEVLRLLILDDATILPSVGADEPSKRRGSNNTGSQTDI